MTDKAKKLVAAIAALAALAVGAAALAQAGDTPAQSQPGAEASEATAPENSAAGKDNVQDENGKDDATEKGEKREAPEGKEGNEVPGDDGPGGHADEPENPNADHQFQGEE